MTSPTPIEQVVTGTGQSGLVSVVIPTYNRGYILGKTIESVLAQRYRPIEVIIVDDGSTDDTEKVVSRFGRGVRYFRQENAGVSAARNRGLREVSGEYIALLDSDDTWFDWKIPAQVAVLDAHPEVGMVWTDMVAVDVHGAVHHPRYLRKFYSAYEHVRLEDVFDVRACVSDFWPDAPAGLQAAPVYIGDVFQYMFLGNLVHTSTVLIRRERLQKTGGFDLGLKCAGEDYDFHLRTTSHGAVAFLDASSIVYRVGADDQLTAPEYGIYVARNNLVTIMRCLDQRGDRIHLPRPLVCERLAESFSWLGDKELHLGQHREAFVHYCKSFRYKPAMHAASRACLALLPGGTFNALRTMRRKVAQQRSQNIGISN